MKPDAEFQAKLDAGRCPAIPPSDYTGSQAEWMIQLQQRGLWDGDGWHGDVWISDDDWWEILEDCEGVPAGECSVRCTDEKHHKKCRLKS